MGGANLFTLQDRWFITQKYNVNVELPSFSTKLSKNKVDGDAWLLNRKWNNNIDSLKGTVHSEGHRYSRPALRQTWSLLQKSAASASDWKRGTLPGATRKKKGKFEETKKNAKPKLISSDYGMRAKKKDWTMRMTKKYSRKSGRARLLPFLEFARKQWPRAVRRSDGGNSMPASRQSGGMSSLNVRLNEFLIMLAAVLHTTTHTQRVHPLGLSSNNGPATTRVWLQFLFPGVHSIRVRHSEWTLVGAFFCVCGGEKLFQPQKKPRRNMQSRCTRVRDPVGNRIRRCRKTGWPRGAWGQRQKKITNKREINRRNKTRQVGKTWCLLWE